MEGDTYKAFTGHYLVLSLPTLSESTVAKIPLVTKSANIYVHFRHMHERRKYENEDRR